MALKKEEKIFVVLLVVALLLTGANVVKFKGWLIPKQEEIQILNNTVVLDSLSIEQKIAQMTIGIGIIEYLTAYQKMQLGGVYLYSLGNAWVFNNTIIDFQYNSKIPMFISVDLEGCFNPFSAFHNFTTTIETETIGEAFAKGFREGEFLNNLGVNMNFAPVVDLDDEIWKCRAFPGDKLEISELAQSYTLGLQTQGVIATAKHYPGKALVVKDPHKFLVSANIEKEDLFPYEYLKEKRDVQAIMVTHVISSGEIDSKGVPAVVSKDVIESIRKNYDGLIITDEIHMLGLKNFYDTVDEMYIAVFEAGNDIILNFDKDPLELYRMITVVSDAVRSGKIPLKQIDSSVTRVLKAKGFEVK
jgi:beta-N-acetylhexosaminidase